MPPTTTGTSPAPARAARAGSRAPAPCASRTGSRCRRGARPRQRRQRRSAAASAGCPGRRPRNRRRAPARPPARPRCCGRPGPAWRPGRATARRVLAVWRTRSRTAASAESPSPPTPTVPDTPVGARYSPKTSRRRAGPLPRRDPGPGALQGRGHEVGAGARLLAQPGERGLDPLAAARRAVARLAPAADRLGGAGLDLGVDALDGRVEVGGERVRLRGLEAVDADDDVLAGPRSAGGAGRARRRGRTSCSRSRRPRPRRPSPRYGPSRPGRPRRGRPPSPRPRRSRRTGRRTRAGRTRTPAPAASAATTAGPTASAGRAPRSTAGSCTARALASLDSVTASISRTIRCTLFSGWASVRPSELTCTP